MAQYLLTPDEFIDNSKSLNEMKREIAFLDSKSFTKSATPSALPEVKTLEAIAQAFDASQCPCQLPQKVKNKLKGENWVPKDVDAFIKNDFGEKAYQLKGESVVSLLHKVKIKPVNGDLYEIVVAGAPTFKNINITNFIVKEAKDYFIFTLDCSGYLNAAISASGGAPGLNIKTESEAALTIQKSILIAGGTVVSPISAAYYGNEVVGIEMDKNERIKVLKALISNPDLKDTDTIIAQASYQLLWSTTNGSSGFNGKADLKSGGGASLGVAQVSFNTDSGLEISRKSSFSTYNTLFTGMKYFNFKPFTVNNVKQKIAQLSQ